MKPAAAILAAAICFVLGVALGIRRPCQPTPDRDLDIPPRVSGGYVPDRDSYNQPWTRDDDEPIAPADPWTYRPTTITAWWSDANGWNDSRGVWHPYTRTDA